MKKDFDDAMKNVLGRIRANNTGADARDFTQAAYNLAQARNVYFGTEAKQEQEEEPKTQKKSGASAS
jgi:hypothetical protein